MRPTIFLMTKGPRAPQNPEDVPFKMQMPFELRNRITGKNTKLKERGCLYEISLVLSCLVEHNYEDKYCTKEATAFNKCYTSFLTNKNAAKEQARKGILTPNTKKLKYNQINLLLRQYPHV